MLPTCGLYAYFVMAPYIDACLEERGAEELPERNTVEQTLPWRSPTQKGTGRLKFIRLFWWEKQQGSLECSRTFLHSSA